MIQVHLWIPSVVYVEDWKSKIDLCLSELDAICSTIEFGPLKTHVRDDEFCTEQLAEVLDEAMFIPLIRQIHIIVLVDHDILPLDSLRIVDHLVHIDSIARLTRRIQTLVFDLVTPNTFINKISSNIIKEGIQSVSTVMNSKTLCADICGLEHDDHFSQCQNCNKLIEVSLASLLIKVTTDNPVF
jgi:hypothetical protein